MHVQTQYINVQYIRVEYVMTKGAIAVIRVLSSGREDGKHREEDAKKASVANNGPSET